MRVNTTAGTFKDIETTKSQWFVHKSADVAAIPLDYRTEDALAFKSIELHWFVGADHKFRPEGPEFDKRLKQWAPYGIPLAVGDQLFFTGLFVSSAGKDRNLPIARFGNISRMPEGDLIRLKTEARGEISVTAYLAESHSWGGHSGSPAFWHFEYPEARPMLIDKEMVDVHTARRWVRGFLGLVSAHFDISMRATDTKDQPLNDILTRLNAGIAVITPAENIRELLMKDPNVLKDRANRKAGAHSDSAATADSIPPDDPVGPSKRKRKNRDIPIPDADREKFFDDLEKATRKLKP